MSPSMSGASPRSPRLHSSYFYRGMDRGLAMKFATESTQGYLTDADLESEGIWVEINETVKMRIRRSGGANTAYTRAVTDGYKRFKRRVDANQMSNEEIDTRILRPAFIQHVLVDWIGVMDADGNEVPFDQVAAEAFFETVPEIYRTLAQIAGDIQWFQAQENEEVAEQLGNSSRGH